MRMRVDEPRCHHSTRHVETSSAGLGDRAHLDDAAISHSDVGHRRRRTGPIDEGSTGKYQIEHAAIVPG